MPGRILVDTTPLRESRDFRLLFTGQLVSMLGTQLTVVAIPYQVYSTTHSSLQVGAISLAQLIPFLAGALSAGPVGDASRPAPDHGLDGRGHDAHQRGHGRQRRRDAPVARRALRRQLPRRRSDGLLQHRPDGVGPGPGRAPPPDRRLRADADHHPGGDGRRSRAPASCSASDCRSSTRSMRVSFVVAGIAAVMLRPIPPAEGPGALSPWESTKEGLRYLRSRQALQGVYLIDINAMVFGMPAGRLPRHGGLGVRRRHGHARLPFTPPAGRARADRRGDHGVGGEPARQGWRSSWRSRCGARPSPCSAWSTRSGSASSCSPSRAGPTRSRPSCATRCCSPPSPNASAVACPPFRWRWCRGGPRVGDMESGAVATLTSVEFSVVRRTGLHRRRRCHRRGPAGLPPYRAGEVDDVPVCAILS